MVAARALARRGGLLGAERDRPRPWLHARHLDREVIGQAVAHQRVDQGVAERRGSAPRDMMELVRQRAEQLALQRPLEVLMVDVHVPAFERQVLDGGRGRCVDLSADPASVRDQPARSGQDVDVDQARHLRCRA